MKELTIEQKAQAYDKAIQRGLDYIRHTPATEMVTRQDIFEAIFPEFKEPEDEKLRKEMLQIAKESEDSFYMVLTPKKKETLISLLEKQGKQNSTWSEEDEENRKNCIFWLEQAQKYFKQDKDLIYEDKWLIKYIDWLKSIGPYNRQEPSDEQKRICREVYADILSAKGFDLATINSELKRLEEQLDNTVNHHD